MRIIVAGIGVDVGKTVVSAILTSLFAADYWKPIQCGEEEESDSSCLKRLIGPLRHKIFPSAYSLKAPLSPHHAAKLENREIRLDRIELPETKKPLIIESVGGVLVPLTTRQTTIDLFQKWEAKWIVVSRHYLGSINHTLLTIEALQKRKVELSGLIFNGEPNPDSEEAILEGGEIRCLARLLPERQIDTSVIERYAKEWKENFCL